MQMLEDGEYDGVIYGPASVYENKNGVLTAEFIVAFKPAGEVERKAFISLTKRDGSINEFQVKNVKEIFPKWDGTDISWLTVEDNTNNTDVVVVVKNENGYSNIKEMFSPNHTKTTTQLKQGMDAKSLQAKYGAKFRALAGNSATIKPKAREDNLKM